MVEKAMIMRRYIWGQFPGQWLLNYGSVCVGFAGALLGLLAIEPAVNGNWPLAALLLMLSGTALAISFPLAVFTLTLHRTRGLRDLSARIDELSKRIEAIKPPDSSEGKIQN